MPGASELPFYAHSFLVTLCTCCEELVAFVRTQIQQTSPTPSVMRTLRTRRRLPQVVGVSANHCFPADGEGGRTSAGLREEGGLLASGSFLTHFKPKPDHGAQIYVSLVCKATEVGDTQVLQK